MDSGGRVVVKVGTGVLTGGRAELDLERMADLARQIAKLRADGYEVLLVSSGAIAAGRARLPLDRMHRDVPTKQMLAAIGQHLLMQTYDQLLSPYGIAVAQTLLTKADLRHRLGYLNARNTLLGLLEHGVLPIINENDVIAVDEIRFAENDRLFGENDNLAAMVANLVDAHTLINLTNAGGLFTADPRLDPDARLIPEVARINKCIEALAGGAGTAQGTGGMRTKIEAAKLATASGITVIIAPGFEPDVLLRLATGEPIGTRFRPTASRRESRKRWILSALASHAAVHVDHGAADAIRRRGRSLLAAGVKSVSGRFGRGDPISVIALDGERIACGLANYSSTDVDQIKGVHSQGILGMLGYAYGDEVIHRNNLVLLASDE
ncbi:MAG: glutamate 5-kinase [Chloroflexi bacterium]|nr:glutamate 5-kinase [Chloroflexota bacterium]